MVEITKEVRKNLDFVNTVAGRDQQFITSMEECAELIQCISKELRNKSDIDHLAEEMADTIISLDCLAQFIPEVQDKIQPWVDFKSRRGVQRLREYACEGNSVPNEKGKYMDCCCGPIHPKSLGERIDFYNFIRTNGNFNGDGLDAEIVFYKDHDTSNKIITNCKLFMYVEDMNSALVEYKYHEIPRSVAFIHHAVVNLAVIDDSLLKGFEFNTVTISFDNPGFDIPIGCLCIVAHVHKEEILSNYKDGLLIKIRDERNIRL